MVVSSVLVSNTTPGSLCFQLGKVLFECNTDWWAYKPPAILTRQRLGTFEQNLSQHDIFN